ncbi:MAG: HD domain-containing phosphohydrolase [Candidatus Omnitrophota bacterium]
MVGTKVTTSDIVSSIDAGLCLLDRSFHIVWLNKRQAEWLGTRRNTNDKHCYEVFANRNQPCPGCPALRVFQSGQVRKAIRTSVSKDGHKHYYQVNVSPIKDRNNKVKFVLELVNDITSKAMQKEISLRVIKKLKNMYGKVACINKKLFRNTRKLKIITEQMSNFKVVIHNKYRKKVSELKSVKKDLEDIFKVNHAFSSTLNFKEITHLITRFTCELMHTDACILRLLDKEKRSLKINASYKVSNNFIEDMSVINMGESIGGRAAALKEPISVYNMETDNRLKNPKVLEKEGFKSLLSVPVVFQDEVLGVISTYSKRPRKFTREEIEVLSIFASHVAVAIVESRHYEDIHKTYFNTIKSLVLAVEAKDPFLCGHTDRVTKYALEIARKLNFSAEEMELLRYAAEVHDVGKIGIPDAVLNKPGKLDPTERAIIEEHPVKGANMLQPLDFLKEGIPVVRHHHERYDGGGYPDGLDRDKIPLMARIITCVDAFDAMTSERPYRSRKFTIEEALLELRRNAGTQFDPNIVNLFVQIIRSQTPNLSPA